jgi:hypothetical protein
MVIFLPLYLQTKPPPLLLSHKQSILIINALFHDVLTYCHFMLSDNSVNKTVGILAYYL